MPSLSASDEASDLRDSRRIDRIFLWHLWACVPFAPLWIIHSENQPDPLVARAMRSIAAACGFYLVLRTVVVFGGLRPERWTMLWPVMDVVLITAILLGVGSGEDPTSFLYLLAIAYATLTLSFRRAVGIVALAVAGQLFAGIATNTWAPYLVQGKVMYVLFRPFFLLLLASLVLLVSREMQRWRARTTLAEYQSELAGEMHDGIQHDLVLIARRLDLAAAVADSDARRAVDIAVGERETARRASDELRFLIHQTGRGPAPGAAFVEGLNRHLSTLSARYGLPIAFVWEGGSQSFPPAFQHPVLRIIQEAVTNTVKHARAARIGVRIRHDSRGYCVRIEDDGDGFDPGLAGAGGFGLASMRSRAERIGGTLRIVSRPGAGTRVTLRLPHRAAEKRWWHDGTHPRGSGRG